MPSGWFHFLVAVSVAIVCVLVWPGFIVYALVFVVFSCLPDVDSRLAPQAVFLRRFCLLGFLLGGLSYFLWPNTLVGWFAVFCLGLVVVQSFADHRGFFHSFVGGLLLASPLALLGPIWFAAGLGGYCCHLFVDGCFKWI